MPALLVRSGPLAGRRVPVDAELVIGRAQADLSIEDPEVSRRHAAVRPVAGGLEVEDLGSRNGTFLNEGRIQGRVRLAPGDVLRVGQTLLEVEVEAEVAPQQPLVAPQHPIAPAQPFGAFSPPTPAARRAVATRQLTPTVLTFAAIIATAIALLVYFAARG